MPVVHSLHSEAGTVVIDTDTCIACGACARICPAEILRLEEGRIQVHPESMFGCIACGHCMMVCPTQSVAVSGRDISPADVVPLPLPEERAGWPALAALMESRRSIRRFTGQEPGSEVLERIVALAAQGPMGIPPWDVGCVIVQGREQVQRLGDEIIGGYRRMLKLLRPWLLALLRPVMKRSTHDQFTGFLLPLAQAYVRSRDQGRDLLFYDAPALLLFHHSPLVDSGETMIACTHAMLAAESLGLGTTIIGAAAPILHRKPELCRRLGIPPGNKPAIVLIIGYPAVRFRRGVRRRFSSVSTIK